MKSLQMAVVFGSLVLCSGAALAGSISLNEFTAKVMPVLVQVNALGKVTSVSPAVKLSPQIARLLRANLDEMITAPASDGYGRAVSSQFVINLTLNASPRTNGNYDAKFAYVSTAPVPAGSWYWVHIDGYRVALASQDGLNRRQISPYRYNRNETSMPSSYQPSPMPTISSPSPSPAPAPTPGNGR